MMTTKERERVKRYLNSEGLKAAWYYIIIALTMGNVDTAVDEYNEDTDRLRRVNSLPIIEDFKEEDAKEGGAYTGSGFTPSGIGMIGSDDDAHDDLSDELLTAAILAQHMNDNPETVVNDYDEAGGEEGWGGFGGGGDASGGGAGGSWDSSDSY